MSHHLKSYGIFLAFLLVTKVVVSPIARNLNIPLVSDALK